MTDRLPVCRQHGIALVIVLLILAIATVAVVSMSSSRQLDSRRSENLLRMAEAYNHLYSLESWAAQILRTERKANAIDTQDDAWSQPLPTTIIAGGTMSAQLVELQGRFNLNNLLIENQPSTIDVQRFRRLLVLLDIKPQIIDAILDWQDNDADIRYPAGAEDETYFEQPKPYRSANRALADIRELLNIAGISQDDYAKLKPYIYVTNHYAPMNINTADPLLLRCLADDLTAKQIDWLSRARQRKPFATLSEFLQQDIIATSGINKQGLSVTSEAFLLLSQINIGKLTLRFASQLHRHDNGTVELIARRRLGAEHD